MSNSLKLPLDHPLRELDNVTLSPHNGYANDTSYKVRKFYIEKVEELKFFLPKGLLGADG
jgi:26S proteasome regulatory subunit N2